MRILLLISLVSLSISGRAQLSNLNDEFYTACSIEDWQNVNIVEGWGIEPLAAHDINMTSEGMMHLMPHTSTWYENYKGAFLFKEVADDVILTTRVIVTNRTEDGLPSSSFSLAGIMIRSATTLTNGAAGWTGGQENYIFLSIGTANGNGNTPQFEVKNTINSSSTLGITNISSNDVLIRLARIGDYIIMMRDADGNGFVVHERYDRSDFPSDMQIGFFAYTDWPKASTYAPIFQNSNILDGNLNPDPSSNPGLNFNPDLIGNFDYARFNSVNLPVALVGVDLTNETLVSDAMLLSFLGFAAEPLVEEGKVVWNGSVDSDWDNASNWNGGVVPTNQDSVLIPNCDCPEVQAPVFDLANRSILSLEIEEGATLTIQAGSTLTIDPDGNTIPVIFNNQGTMVVEGEVSVQRNGLEQLLNRGVLNLNGVGVFRVEE